MISYPDLLQYIGGAWRAGRGQGKGYVCNPADNAELAVFSPADESDIDDALVASAAGFSVWRKMPPAERAAILHRAAQLIRDRSADIGSTLTREGGKPLHEASREALRSADLIDWDAEEGRRTYGQVVPGAEGFRQLVLREPVGPVAAFIAWNFPASFVARKLGAALSAGCSVILKAPQETPGTVVTLVRCFADAGLPAGVLNLLIGNAGSIADRLIASPVIRAVTLTGSTAVGKVVAGVAARHLKPCILELGGHAPVVVDNDIDMRSVVSAAIASKYSNAGQVCVSPTRFYVHRDIYDSFVEEFAAGAGNIRVGPGLQPDTQMGPLINQKRLDAMERFVADAKAKGARVAAGGSRIGNQGFFFAPTVLADMPASAEAMSEEPFGPLALVAPFDTLDDAIREANSLPYGLAAYGFTQSSKAAARLTNEIECGYLAINHFLSASVGLPFGGVKESGYGREGGGEGVAAYMTTKSVSHFNPRD